MEFSIDDDDDVYNIEYRLKWSRLKYILERYLTSKVFFTLLQI